MPRESGYPVITVVSVGDSFRHAIARRLLDSPPARGMTRWVSLLLQNALRMEVADAAALGTGRRIDHRVDQGRLAGIHRFVDGAFQVVRRGDVDAGAAKGLHHLVVAR